MSKRNLEQDYAILQHEFIEMRKTVSDHIQQMKMAIQTNHDDTSESVRKMVQQCASHLSDVKKYKEDMDRLLDSSVQSYKQSVKELVLEAIEEIDKDFKQEGNKIHKELVKEATKIQEKLKKDIQALLGQALTELREDKFYPIYQKMDKLKEEYEQKAKKLIMDAVHEK